MLWSDRISGYDSLPSEKRFNSNGFHSQDAKDSVSNCQTWKLNALIFQNLSFCWKFPPPFWQIPQTMISRFYVGTGFFGIATYPPNLSVYRIYKILWTENEGIVIFSNLFVELFSWKNTTNFGNTKSRYIEYDNYLCTKYKSDYQHVSKQVVN